MITSHVMLDKSSDSLFHSYKENIFKQILLMLIFYI